MIKTIPLSEIHKQGLRILYTWLDTFPKPKEVYFLGRMKDISYFQFVITKVLNTYEYTEEERIIFNELRQRYLDKNIQEDLPF
jgi:recombinational DNA repair protein RecR